ncbi:MAG: bacteriohemerythrin [Nitrosomonadales bacterium]|nr:bacteriohemerythrin [Nitrosomonadales bacterium]
MDSIEIFPWDENFNTGIAIIDEQHERLAQLLNRLSSHVAYKSDNLELDAIFDELADYAVYHFQTEEAIWHEHFGEEQLKDEHLEIHDSFSTTVLRLKNNKDNKPAEVIIAEILSFLTRWLASHILETDRHMAKIVLALQDGMPMDAAKEYADEQMRGSTKVLIDLILSTYNSMADNTLHLIAEITRHKQTAQTLTELLGAMKERNARIQSFLDSSLGAIVSVDGKGAVIDWNRQAERIFGYPAKDAIGHRIEELIVPKQLREAHRDGMARFIETGKRKHPDKPMESTGLRANGKEFPVELSFSSYEHNGDLFIIAYLSDISDRKMAMEQIEHLAFYCPLTKLPNRRLLMDRLSQAQVSSLRSGRLGALLFIDLDEFKKLNDTLGHEIGDLLLQQVAQRLETCVRDGDTVARLGGDEFVVVLESLSSIPLTAAIQAETICEKITQALNRNYQLKDVEYHITSSIGITLFGIVEQPLDELLKQSDIAMYQAKRAGRNTVCLFDREMQQALNAKIMLEHELDMAIKENQFRLHYQIQVDEQGRPLGAEALVRWQHPERGLVFPDEFISVAEETGSILAIGDWVLDMACAQLADWRHNGSTADFTLSVNVSARQFRQVGLADKVNDAIRRHDIRPESLKLELTESILLDDIEETIATIGALKKIGIRFSLDDFGTGFSSLQYIKRLPFDQIKIDQIFVRDLVSDSNDRALTRAIIAMAVSMDFDVIAEGVETEEQKALLLQKGCTKFQGFLFGKPMPITEFNRHFNPSSGNPG